MRDGTEFPLLAEESFNISGLRDFTFSGYGRDSAKDFREFFSDKKNLIVPGIIIYDDKYLKKDCFKRRVSDSLEDRKKCLVNAIVFD